LIQSYGQNPPILHLEEVGFTYTQGKKSVEALAPTNLTIQKGEFVSLVGPSGCGKTTLLRLIAGLIFPTRGRILCEGEPIVGTDWRRGLSFQQPQLFPWLTVKENIGFGPKVLGLGSQEIKERTETFVAMVKLEEFQDAYPYELSGGMQQRAALARALANKPHILLLDEPLGALDALTREHMQDELKLIWEKTGVTIILVTHSVDEAVYLGTRVLVSSARPATLVYDAPIQLPKVLGSGRIVKSTPEFIQVRDKILTMVWDS
jgi:ABC-type nitrate/sulfonate/bicarbonate transport system ATPase subunit